MKVGIVGTGFTAQAHIEALKRLHNVNIIAISSRNLEKARAFAKKYDIRKSYDDFYALIDDEEVEVIHNCTPNHVHFDVMKYALEKNKHIISEKPLALNSKQSEQLLQLAEKSRGIAGVCFNYRFFPMVQQLKAMISDRQHGKPFLVRGGYIQDWLLYPSDYNWRLEPEMNGPSRAIADIGSHWCDTIQFVLGKKIVAVFADLETVHKERFKAKEEQQTFGSATSGEVEKRLISTEDFGSVLVRFEDGVKGSFTVSQVTAGRKNHFHFEISTEQAAYYWDQEKPNTLWIGHRDEANKELVKDPSLLDERAVKYAHYPGGHQEGWPDALKNLFVDFYQTIENGQIEVGSFATIQESHHVMKLIDAILESNEKQQWITLN
ncbi:Gfo/Idh/MocA family protein [Halalkalibacterium ligniniphilum]|uniref:Gfo/Idh/MocA family protein n=1 Tax=Halalkalibacterium ligniniphilum TaxID=1134413 RepID=UPI00034D4C6C|nr:Gfo/Idh/MocA family oxidoreductase [Halalkalibacterium ligniniphilum]